MLNERLTEQVMVRLTPLTRKRAKDLAQQLSKDLNRRVTESEVIRHAVDVFFSSSFIDDKPKGGDDTK